jgi:ABC-type dipeptide/oligopeptide/nickel transport system ATPase subunit
MGFPLLSVRNVRIEYGSRADPVVAVRDCSFDIQAGEVFALVGESGSGKSSLARAVAGIVKPVEGSILLEGEPLAPLGQRSAADLQVIQMVFQDPDSSLSPLRTVGKILEEPLEIMGTPRGQRRDRAHALMKLVHLDPALLDRRPDALSGGQKQRVAIARALALEPRLLIADEALSALDMENQEKISTLLMEVRDRMGLAILFVSHDMRSVRRLADAVCVLEGGRVVEQGRVSEILYTPKESYTKLLLASALNPSAVLADPALLNMLSDGELPGEAEIGKIASIIRANAHKSEVAR